MDSITSFLDYWFKQGLIEATVARFSSIFASVNQRVGEIAVDVGATPQSFNSSVFDMIRTLSETVVLPIAGLILTFVLTYELITMIIEKNNMVEVDGLTIYKWVLKAFAAVFILSNAFPIVMGIFELAQTVVNASPRQVSVAFARFGSSRIRFAGSDVSACDLGLRNGYS